MVMWKQVIFLVNLVAIGLTGKCYNESNCMGTGFDSSSARDCCVNEGMSYSDDAINCNLLQCIVHGFNNTNFSVREGSRLQASFGINVKGETRFPTLQLAGEILLIDAANNTLLREHTSVLGATPITYSPPVDNIALELNDTVRLIFSPENPLLLNGIEEAGEFIRHTATVSIVDSDRLEIYFEQLDYAIDEGGTQIPAIRLIFSKRTRFNFNLKLRGVPITLAEMLHVRNFTDASRATSVSDFIGGNVTVTVPPTNGRTLQLLPPFQIIDDRINENSEIFALVAEIDINAADDVVCFKSTESALCHEKVGATEIVITDNDATFIGFEQRRQTVSESRALPGYDGFYMIVRVNSSVSERIDYPVRIRVTNANATVEGSTTLFESKYDALFGSRDSRDDPITETHIVQRGVSSIDLIVFIHQDTLVEKVECFSLLISGLDIEGERDTSSCQNDGTNSTNYFCLHTICIEDDDALTVGFVKPVYTVAECDGQVEVCVNLTQSDIDLQDNLIHLDVSTSNVSRSVDATNATPMIDYEVQTVDINGLKDHPISRNTTVACYNQTIYCDTQLEQREYFSLSLVISNLSTTKVVVYPEFGEAAVIIVDGNITVDVCLQNTVYFGMTGQIEVCAVIQKPDIHCPVQFPFNITLTTTDGVSPIMKFSECERQSCVVIRRSAFPAFLERTTNLDNRIQLCPDRARLFTARVEFERAVYSVTENAGKVTVCVVIRGETAGQDILITIFTQDGTATAPVNYNHTEVTSVTTGRLCVTIPIFDNYLPGNYVEFSVTAISGSHTTIPSAITTVKIQDDEILRGCTYEVINASLTEELEREEVIVEIAEALSSVFTTPLGGIVGGFGGLPPASNGSSNDSSDEPPLRAVYTSIADEFNVEATEEGYSNFTLAITQITTAKKEACEKGGLSEANVSSLAREYKSLKSNIDENIDRVRDIFGKMLCLNERSSTASRRKRQGFTCPGYGEPCSCPESGVVVCVCEFFRCLDTEDIGPILGIEDVCEGDSIPCLAFAVDTTGSMGSEIAAAKTVVKSLLSHEEQGAGCYVLQPFNDHKDGEFDPTSIPPATIATTYNEYTSTVELTAFIAATDAMTANGGGDGPERQFRTLMTILSLTQDDLIVMMPGSEIVLLTDATSHDADLEDDIIAKAREMKVCISFYLSYSEWEPYNRIAAQTGGSIVFSLRPDAFLGFENEHDYGQCRRFYELGSCTPSADSRKKRAVDTTSFTTAKRCHYFNTSALTTLLTIRGVTAQANMTVTKPSGERIVVAATYSGDKVYQDNSPEQGQWSACVGIGTLTISLDKTDSIGSNFQYLSALIEDPSFSLHSLPPPACTEGRVSIQASNIGGIGPATLQLLDSKDGDLLSSTSLHRCGNRLMGNVSLPQATVGYRVVGNDRSGISFNASLSKTAILTQEEGAQFHVKINGGSEIEAENGQVLTLVIQIHNYNDSSATQFSFSHAAVTGFRQAFRPTSLEVLPGSNRSVSMVIIPPPSSVNGSTYTFTATVSNGCVIHSVSKTVTFITPAPTPPPADNECGCVNGGRCVIRIFRGRRILRCVCPTGYSGTTCANET